MARRLTPFDVRRHDMRFLLPFDLFNENGVLILAQGSDLGDAARVAKMAEIGLYRMETESAQESKPSSEVLSELAERYTFITAPERKIDPRELVSIADELNRLLTEQSDLCVGMLLHLEMGSSARRHALFVAALSYLVAVNLGLGRATQKTLIRAALSMNLASFELQDELAGVARPLTAEERESLSLHPWRSTEMLAKAGVTDINWLRTVLQHHENLDQSGYPYRVGKEALVTEARILRVVDVFAAMLSPRYTRSAFIPSQAVRMAFERERGHLDDAVMLILRRLIGKYPPGTLVKLANRETAVITRWFRNADTPRFVVSLLWPSGHPMQLPHARKTSLYGYGIREHTSLPLAGPQLDWPKIWAQG